MNTFLLIVILTLTLALGVFILLKKFADKKLAQAKTDLAQQIETSNKELEQAKTDLAQQIETSNKEVQALREEYSREAGRIHADYEQRIAGLENEAERIRQHYQNEAQKAQEEAHAALLKAQADVVSLARYANLVDAEKQVGERLQAAIIQAEALESEAQSLLQQAKDEAENERQAAHIQAKDIYVQAEALLMQTQRDASRIHHQAEQHAQQLAGEAYEALSQKRSLEGAVQSIRNIIEGYGDRYIVPTHSLLDELAADFGHIAAGVSLRIARENSRRMVEEGTAASCDYAQNYRSETAIRFVVDAFNGKVDGILSRLKNDNYGTLEQEIRDAFKVVNLNGEAFRNARILEPYLLARIEELRWGASVFELKRKEREEQRRIQEQIREEERARREYEKAMQAAAKEEAAIKRALEKAQAEMSHASETEKAKYEQEMAQLQQRLAEAEAKNQRAISMAQQTRSGNVYIISNVGSFGEDVLKIGMTRRLEPLDRVKELGDASVPFEFDVHAMIQSDDAPSLERELHGKFEEFRINKVNYRKEFFRIPLHHLREFVTEKNLEATFTMTAEAREFRETQALQHMSVEERAKYHKPEEPEGEE
jgi:DNA repair exonuclease SbcCD ATPase subunit